MSWMQYLAVSRSFSSVEDRPTRFRMRQQHLLPRFGEDLQEVSATESVAASPDDAVRGGISRPLEKGSPMENGTSTTPMSTATPRDAYPGGRWRIWRRAGTDQTRDAREPMLVQPELRLDTVKVIRNDLTDSDLLLVPLRNRAEATVRSSKPEARKTASPRWWSRLLGFIAGF